ncbi:MAG: hypothetical protein JWO50_743 [Candidatus Kaiserbacteria bacterium]|nr:hypothetical protein [Candidatus Kaiserbacteria bacterium]
MVCATLEIDIPDSEAFVDQVEKSPDILPVVPQSEVAYRPVDRRSKLERVPAVFCAGKQVRVQASTDHQQGACADQFVPSLSLFPGNLALQNELGVLVGHLVETVHRLIVAAERVEKAVRRDRERRRIQRHEHGSFEFQVRVEMHRSSKMNLEVGFRFEVTQNRGDALQAVDDIDRIDKLNHTVFVDEILTAHTENDVREPMPLGQSVTDHLVGLTRDLARGLVVVVANATE